MLLALACADADDPSKLPTDETTDTGDVVDSGDVVDTDTTDTAADGYGPTTGTLANNFTFTSADVKGNTRLDELVFADGAGELSLVGDGHIGVVYLDHDWADAGYHLYDVLSVAEDGSALAVTYLYAQGTSVPYAYTESYDLPMDWETTSGTLNASTSASSVAVDLPALEKMPPGVATGFSATGDLELTESTGTLSFDGVSRDVYPLDVVDCTDCPGGPWYEIHMVAAEADACFAIVYLFPEDPERVQLEYGLCLPSLARLSGPLDVAWSGAPSALRARSDAPIRGVPPPR